MINLLDIIEPPVIKGLTVSDIASWHKFIPLIWLAVVALIYLIAWFDYFFYAHHWNKKIPILWNSLFEQ